MMKFTYRLLICDPVTPTLPPHKKLGNEKMFETPMSFAIYRLVLELYFLFIVI